MLFAFDLIIEKLSHVREAAQLEALAFKLLDYQTLAVSLKPREKTKSARTRKETHSHRTRVLPTVKVNRGKSVLFEMDPEILPHALKTSPLQLWSIPAHAGGGAGALKHNTAKVETRVSPSGRAALNLSRIANFLEQEFACKANDGSSKDEGRSKPDFESVEAPSVAVKSAISSVGGGVCCSRHTVELEDGEGGRIARVRLKCRIACIHGVNVGSYESVSEKQQKQQILDVEGICKENNILENSNIMQKQMQLQKREDEMSEVVVEEAEEGVVEDGKEEEEEKKKEEYQQHSPEKKKEQGKVDEENEPQTSILNPSPCHPPSRESNPLQSEITAATEDKTRPLSHTKSGSILYLPNSACPPPLFYHANNPTHSTNHTGTLSYAENTADPTTPPTTSCSVCCNDMYTQWDPESHHSAMHWSILAQYDHSTHPLNTHYTDLMLNTGETHCNYKESPINKVGPVSALTAEKSASARGTLSAKTPPTEVPTSTMDSRASPECLDCGVITERLPLISGLLKELSTLRTQLHSSTYVGEHTERYNRVSVCVQTDGSAFEPTLKSKQNHERQRRKIVRVRCTSKTSGRTFMRECCQPAYTLKQLVPKSKSVLYAPDIKHKRKRVALNVNTNRKEIVKPKERIVAAKAPDTKSKNDAPTVSENSKVGNSIGRGGGGGGGRRRGGAGVERQGRSKKRELGRGDSSSIHKLEVFIPCGLQPSPPPSSTSSSLKGSTQSVGAVQREVGRQDTGTQKVETEKVRRTAEITEKSEPMEKRGEFREGGESMEENSVKDQPLRVSSEMVSGNESLQNGGRSSPFSQFSPATLIIATVQSQVETETVGEMAELPTLDRGTVKSPTHSPKSSASSTPKYSPTSSPNGSLRVVKIPTDPPKPIDSSKSYRDGYSPVKSPRAESPIDNSIKTPTDTSRNPLPHSSSQDAVLTPIDQDTSMSVTHSPKSPRGAKRSSMDITESLRETPRNSLDASKSLTELQSCSTFTTRAHSRLHTVSGSRWSERRQSDVLHSLSRFKMRRPKFSSVSDIQTALKSGTVESPLTHSMKKKLPYISEDTSIAEGEEEGSNSLEEEEEEGSNSLEEEEEEEGSKRLEEEEEEEGSKRSWEEEEAGVEGDEEVEEGSQTFASYMTGDVIRGEMGRGILPKRLRHSIVYLAASQSDLYSEESEREWEKEQEEWEKEQEEWEEVRKEDEVGRKEKAGKEEEEAERGAKKSDEEEDEYEYSDNFEYSASFEQDISTSTITSSYRDS